VRPTPSRACVARQRFSTSNILSENGVHHSSAEFETTFVDRGNKMNRFSRICLLVIALSLALIALRSVARPVTAAGHFKYLVVTTAAASNSIQAEIDKQAAEGWELAAPLYSEQVPGITLIFRKSD
jgi:hypothetical protein